MKIQCPFFKLLSFCHYLVARVRKSVAMDTLGHCIQEALFSPIIFIKAFYLTLSMSEIHCGKARSVNGRK